MDKTVLYGSLEWYTELFLSTDKHSTWLFRNELMKNPFNINTNNFDGPRFPLKHSIKFCNDQIVYLALTVLNDPQLTKAERRVVSQIAECAHRELELLCSVTGPL